MSKITASTVSDTISSQKTTLALSVLLKGLAGSFFVYYNFDMFNAIKSLFTKSVYGLYKSTDRVGGTFTWSKGKSLSLYEKSLYTNKAIAKRAEKVGQVEFVLTDRKGKKVENEWTKLLDRPNAYMTGDQFWRTVQKYYDIVGFACIHMNYGENQVFRTGKVPQSLEVLRSDMIEIVYNADRTEIVAFRYTPEGGTTTDYHPDDIVYLYNPDPRYLLQGESLLSSAIRAIETEVQISEYHANILRNGGRLETIFKVKDPLGAGQIDKLKEQYRDKYSEARRAGEPLFLGGDIDIEKTSMSPQELAYLDTKVSTLDDIAIATGVPKAILGVTTGETFSNADASIRIFLRETIKPLMDNLVNVLDWRLIPDEFELSFVDPTPEDQEQKMAMLKTANDINAVTLNEKREMLGLEPIKDGDTIYAPFNLSPLGEKPEPQEKVLKKKTFAHPLADADVRRAYAKLADARLERYQRKFLAQTKDFFKGQRERLVTSLGATRKRKNLIDEAYNQTLEINIAKETLLPILRELFKEAGQDTMQTFKLGRFVFTDVMETALQKRAEMFSESIIATTTDQLQNAFKESLDAGESRDQLVNRINELYTDITKGRAETIARTEVHNAVQEANLFGYKQAGLPIKIWVTVGDDRVREEHRSIDGEERPIDMPFSNGLQYPNEINCRCSI
jgi:HK97 family phage portal protein